MVVRKPSTHFTDSENSSTVSSHNPSSVIDWNAAQREVMPSEDYLPAPPLSVRIPTIGATGPYCPRTPSLREILNNKSSPPWTLTAFTAYLSNNHCLETLEFTMDAGRYRNHYNRMMSKTKEAGLPPQKDREYVHALWERLVEAYIQPNGSREVNLPSTVRDPIVHMPPELLPPAPETLDRAVAKVYELMEDSVLVPFLNSLYPQSAQSAVSLQEFDQADDTMSVTTSISYESRSMFSRRGRSVRSTPPVQPAAAQSPIYSAPPVFRKSAPSPLTASSKKAPFVKLTQSTSSPAAPMSDPPRPVRRGPATHEPGMSEDSGSASSPPNGSPDTPPYSPPASDVSSSKRDSNNSGVWQKLGKLGRMKTGKKKNSERYVAEEQ